MASSWSKQSSRVLHWCTKRDGATGDEIGTSSYPGLECSGTLTLVENTADKLVVREKITSDPEHTCAKKVTITLALSGDGLSYSTDLSTARLVRT